MKTLKDLQLFSILESLSEYKQACQLYPDSLVTFMFELVCSSYKNVAFQSAAMQIGLRMGQKDSSSAFEAGAAMLIVCKGIGIYSLHQNDSKIWLTPILQFSEDELYLLDDIQFETHEKPGLFYENADLILSKFSQHMLPLNYDFINKINQVAFVLDQDVLWNFKGENMPITYDRLICEYLTKPIYFNWQFDSRGRSYSKGYGLNIQGNKTVRSVLSFANKEVVIDVEPLYIALANARGFDNWTWKRRIAWSKKQVISHDMIIPKGTKYPEKFVKCVRAILDYQEGIPSGVPMELDATASGIQVMAAITGCEQTANEVNLVDSTKRKDVYGTLARKMSQSDNVDVIRDDVKQAGMTHFYNSEAAPAAVFNDEELEAFYSSIDGMLPGAEFAMTELNKQWNSGKLYHSWELPDGHVAFVRTMTSKEAKYEYDGTTVKYSYYVNQGNKTSYRSLVPNIVHSIDAYIARQMILRADFEMVHVHDCFLFLPNHYKEVMQLYREIMAELVTDYNINHIIKSLSGKTVNHFVDPSLAVKILASSYAVS